MKTIGSNLGLAVNKVSILGLFHVVMRFYQFKIFLNGIGQLKAVI